MNFIVRTDCSVKVAEQGLDSCPPETLQKTTLLIEEDAEHLGEGEGGLR
jgi:hypothetical protein